MSDVLRTAIADLERQQAQIAAALAALRPLLFPEPVVKPKKPAADSAPRQPRKVSGSISESALAALASGPLSGSAVAKAMGVSPYKAGRALEALAASGAVACTGSTTSKRWALTSKRKASDVGRVVWDGTKGSLTN